MQLQLFHSGYQVFKLEQPTPTMRRPFDGMPHFRQATSERSFEWRIRYLFAIIYHDAIPGSKHHLASTCIDDCVRLTVGIVGRSHGIVRNGLKNAVRGTDWRYVIKTGLIRFPATR